MHECYGDYSIISYRSDAIPVATLKPISSSDSKLLYKDTDFKTW